MSIFKKMLVLMLLIGMTSLIPRDAHAAYVTDTGGYAYDECRAAVNLAPAIALGTVAIVGIIAIAVQNSHDHRSSSSFFSHCDVCPSSYCSYSYSAHHSCSCDCHCK